MRRIEDLEIKEPTNINQINPPPIHNLSCYIVRHRTISLKSALFSIPSKCHQNIWMRPTHGRNIIQLADVQSRLEKSP